MGYIILLIVGYFFLRICWKILRHILSPETAALWLVAFGLMIVGFTWAGLLILGWRYILMPIFRYQEKHPRKCRTRGQEKGGGLSNETAMWLIPIFWPFLIAKRLFGGKTYKPSLDEYDYEQHLKSNGK